MRYVIATVVLALLIVGMSNPAQAEQSLKEKYDSLFVLASSGEVMFRDLVEPAKDSIAALGEPVVPYLIEEFATKSARERWAVIHILKRIGSPAVPYLVQALSRPDGLIVQRVCWALGDIGDSAAVEPLVAIGNHDRWQVRDQVAGALGKIGTAGHGADNAVMVALSDSIGQVRKAAAVACGKLGLTEATPGLLAMLDDDFYGARFAAQEALGKLDTTTVVRQSVAGLDMASGMAYALGCDLLSRLTTAASRQVLWREAMTAPYGRHVVAATALIRGDSTAADHLAHFFAERVDDRLARLKLLSARRTYPDHGPQ